MATCWKKARFKVAIVPARKDIDHNPRKIKTYWHFQTTEKPLG